MGDLTKNFSRFEFSCRCGCGLADIHPDTVQALQALRDRLGAPIHINSGCRCVRHNKAVSGATHSYHLKAQGCKAADITTRDVSPSIFADWIENNSTEFCTGGIGRYKGFVHVDVGPKRRW